MSSLHSMRHADSAIDLEQVLDSGIKLPPGVELFPAGVLQLRPTQLAVGMQQVGAGVGG